MLTTIPAMENNPSLLELIYRHIEIKYHKSSSWIITTKATLHKYGLPHIIDVIESLPTQKAWKTEVDKAINNTGR